MTDAVAGWLYKKEGSCRRYRHARRLGKLCLQRGAIEYTGSTTACESDDIALGIDLTDAMVPIVQHIHIAIGVNGNRSWIVEAGKL